MTSSPSNRRRPLARLLAAALGVLLVWLTLHVAPPGRALVAELDRGLGDLLLRWSPGPEPRDDFVLLGIDEASLSLDGYSAEEIEANPVFRKMARRFPWDRSVWAEVVARLANAGARLVILDLLFTEPSEAGPDGDLAAALSRHRERVLLASAFAPVGQGAGASFVHVEPDWAFLDSGAPYGYANFYPDLDGSIRRARYTTTLNEANGQPRHPDEFELHSLAGEAIAMLGGELPAGERRMRFSTAGGSVEGVYEPLSIATLFHPPQWEANYGSGDFFEGKIVMIGPVAPRFQDIKATPVGVVTGPQLHLHALQAGLEGNFVRETRRPLLAIAIGGVLALLWSLLAGRPLLSALGITATLALAYLALVEAASQRQVVTAVGGAFALVAGGITAQTWELLSTRLQRRRLRHELRRFVSHDVADALVQDPERWRATAAGTRRRVAVMFADVRGFTTRSEKSEPEQLVGQLNEYLGRMVGIVFEHRGTLDKFIGDEVMAHWGVLAMLDEEEIAARALAAGKEMLAELERLNGEWSERGIEPFRIGIGIHLGEVMAGEIGSSERTEFAVIGDAVNLASRLQGLTKTFGCPMLVSDALRPDDGFEWIGAVRVRGREQPVTIAGYGEREVLAERLAEMERDAEGVWVLPG